MIRRRYSLALMNAIRHSEPARYKDLATRLPAASSSTLAETLVALETAHLVVHHTSDGSPASTYSLTDSGLKLLERLKPLLDEIQR